MVAGMTTLITQHTDNGDGTVTVTGRTPGGNYVTITVGLDKLADGSVYDALAVAGRSIDSKAGSIAAHDNANTEG
jgi:hypothetical protein